MGARNCVSRKLVTYIDGRPPISPEYINNAQDYNAALHILANKWLIIKNVIQKQRTQEEISEEETQEINDVKSFAKRGNVGKNRNNNKRATKNHTRTTRPSLQRLRKP